MIVIIRVGKNQSDSIQDETLQANLAGGFRLK